MVAVDSAQSLDIDSLFAMNKCVGTVPGSLAALSKYIRDSDWLNCTELEKSALDSVKIKVESCRKELNSEDQKIASGLLEFISHI